MGFFNYLKNNFLKGINQAKGVGSDMRSGAAQVARTTRQSVNSQWQGAKEDASNNFGKAIQKTTAHATDAFTQVAQNSMYDAYGQASAAGANIKHAAGKNVAKGISNLANGNYSNLSEFGSALKSEVGKRAGKIGKSIKREVGGAATRWAANTKEQVKGAVASEVQYGTRKAVNASTKTANQFAGRARTVAGDFQQNVNAQVDTQKELVKNRWKK